MLLRAVVVPAKGILILLIISAVAAEDRSDEFGPTADCLPEEPLIASWTTLQLNCTLNRTDVSADQVSCEFGTEVLRTTVIDSQTFQVIKENMTRQMSHGHVFCHVNVSGKRQPIAQVVVRVADIPTPPKITGCVVYNWNGMICTWEEPQDTGLQTNYTLKWSMTRYNNTERYASCVHPRGNTCEWKAKDVPGLYLMVDQPYWMLIRAENALQTVESSQSYYHTVYLVKPDPVFSMHVVSVSNVSAQLIWRGPDHSDNVRTLTFNISYNSEWDADYWGERRSSLSSQTPILTEEIAYRNTTLVDLLPYTTYNVSIECKRYYNQNLTGFWSNKTYFTFKTAESVPQLAPSITSGGYHIRSADSMERSVVVVWQPLHQKFLQGKLKHYRIQYFNASNGPRLREESAHLPFSHRTTLGSDLDVYVTVEAETSEGRNESLKLDTMLIPRAGTEPPKPEIYYAIGHKSEILVGWSAVSNASGYTVFWCKKGQTRECETSLNWESLPPDITNFTVSTGGFNFREFFIAISVEANDTNRQRVVSSGYVETDCIHDVKKDVLTPENFHLAKDQQAYGLTVEWEKPNCFKTAFIFSYELLYCKKQTCDDKVCCKDNQTLNISNSIKKITVTGLEEDVEYEAWIRSRSLTGVSQFSPPVQHLVFRSGLSPGGIAGIVVATIILIILMIVGFITIAKKMKKSCCGQIMIVPPQKVVFNPNSNEQGISSAGYNGHISVMNDGQNEESITLLIENSTYKNGCLGEQPLKPNGNVGHPREELIQPLIQRGPKVENLYNLEVAPAAGSSISPYTQLAVPGDSATGRQLVEPRKVDVLSPPCDDDDDYHTLRDPASEIVPHAEPKISDKIPEPHNLSYLKADCVLPLGISSSAITPYTTIEQIVDPDVIQATAYPDDSSDISQKAPRDVLCQNGATEVVHAPGVDSCGHNGIVANSQPLCSDQRKLADDDVFRDCAGDAVVQPSTIPSLPASYIQLSA